MNEVEEYTGNFAIVSFGKDTVILSGGGGDTIVVSEKRVSDDAVAGDVLDYEDMFADFCPSCKAQKFFDEKAEEFYCPMCD
jgi:hypothetical protein